MSSDSPDLRASHADRDRVVETLRMAAGDGRITHEELDARVEAALSAVTLGDLAPLTADLPATAAPTGSVLAPAPKDVLLIDQEGGKFVREGRWVVPRGIDMQQRLCKVVLDFTEAVITADTLQIGMDVAHVRLFLLTGPDIVVDADDLGLTYSKVKLQPAGPGKPRLRIELSGNLVHSKVIQRRR